LARLIRWLIRDSEGSRASVSQISLTAYWRCSGAVAGSNATLAWLCRKFILVAMYMLNDRSSHRWPGPPAER